MCFISIFIGKLVSDSVLYVTARSQKMAFSENPELVHVDCRAEIEQFLDLVEL